MKSLLIAIKPKWCAKIMNGDKTIEIRKQFPKDYVGWVYIYCTKGELLQRHWQKVDRIGKFITYGRKVKEKDYDSPHTLNGKVVAKFTLNKVEEIPARRFSVYTYPYTETLDDYELLTKSCLTTKELDDYLGYDKNGYAIHISNLKIFDKPKELSEFKIKRKINECSGCKYLDTNTYDHCIKCEETKPLTKAPQNMIYIEVENNE